MLFSSDIHCPYCGERIEILLDASAGEQSYIEDCQVCCRPISVRVSLDDDGEPHARVSTDDEA
jgi:hypothetical protein